VSSHPVVVDHPTDPQRDLILAAQSSALAACGRGDLVQLGLVAGGEQVLAFAGALLCERRVAAAHQPLPGVVRVGDLGHVLLVEQRQLQRIGLDEGLDLSGAQRGSPALRSQTW
jgi:hypothetical protein